MNQLNPTAIRQLARQVTAHRYPGALAVFLGAAAVGPLHSSTSDLDFVVIEKDTHPRWEGFSAGRWPAEAFVATQQDWQRYLGAEVARRLPVVLHLTATGQPLVDSDLSQPLQQSARDLYETGPRPLDEQEYRLARRLLNDLLDDLPAATDLEATFLINAVAQRVAELALLAREKWLGEGKWLARRLAEADPVLANRMLDAIRTAHAGNHQTLLEVAGEILSQVGGPAPVPWTHDLSNELPNPH
jgi:hypothetical protein